jgi:glycosyltransferase involved in cell wall biosynthesis
MACATPVIAYRGGSVPELVEEGVTGFIVDDVPTAVEAVGKVRQLDRRLCRQRFEQRFTAERMARGYLEIYQRLMLPRQAIQRPALAAQPATNSLVRDSALAPQ